VKVAVTGAAGLFGSALVRVFRARHTVFPLTRADVEITDRDHVRGILVRLRPELIIHAAAIRDPDLAELNPAQAFLVNFHGTRHFVDGAKEAGARVAYISTDSVFDGKKQSPYLESDPAIPGSVYGRTKLRAEALVQATPESWVFRVSILFGPEAEIDGGKARENFISKGLRTIAAGAEYVVAADQLGTATYTVDAAQKIMEVIESGCYGLYHLSNSGSCTRLELARRAAELTGLDPGKVVGKSLAEMNRPGPRLKYAVMAMDTLDRHGFALPRSWEDALAYYVSTDLGLGAGKRAEPPAD
jgi:dTDP-4-dehydrorhamnose reductase